MKKIICLFTAVVLICAMLLPAGAEILISPNPSSGYNTYSSLLVLGDSISTGYGLANYVAGGDPYKCSSYGNRLAAALNLTSGSTYINKAVNGDKTGDLLSLLPSLKSYVAKSELIVISIGGNNLLKNLSVIASAITGQNITSLQQAATAIQGATDADYTRALQDASVQSVISSAVTACGTDVAAICKLIKEYNPNARTVFLKQYNPANNVEAVKAFGVVAGSLIDQINDQLTAAVSAAGEGFELADVPSVIDGAAAANTNILQMDIHPNAAGHGEIYKLLLKQLNIQDPDDVPETTQCVHEWGEWAEVSEDLAAGKRTLERKCTKCGETEQKEEEVTTAEQTTAEVTAAQETSSDVSPETEAPADKKGCGSAASAFGIFALIATAVAVKKRKTL